MLSSLGTLQLHNQQMRAELRALKSQLTEKSRQEELIRQKIIIIAEIFEKKQIDKKYSVDILCDFIFDKAKKMFSKLKEMNKENKVLKSEQNYYVKNRLSSATEEAQRMKHSNDVLTKVVIPEL